MLITLATAPLQVKNMFTVEVVVDISSGWRVVS